MIVCDKVNRQISRKEVEFCAKCTQVASQDVHLRKTFSWSDVRVGFYAKCIRQIERPKQRAPDVREEQQTQTQTKHEQQQQQQQIDANKTRKNEENQIKSGLKKVRQCVRTAAVFSLLKNR